MQPTPGLPGARRAAATLVTALAVAAALAGCSSGGAEASEFQTPTARTAQRLDVTDRDLVDRHPNGAMLQVRSVEVRARSIAVEISLVNGYPDRIDLVDDGLFNDRWLWLIDDLGNAYRYDGRATLGIGPGEELIGSLVFLGVLPDEARQLAVKSNVTDPGEPVDFRDRDIDEDRPVFYVEGIPRP